jgi:cbb3-type cytochrome oxidase subunit 1
LYALHERWANLFVSLTEEQWQRKIFHSGRNAEVSLWDLFAVYAWHGKHHAEQIRQLRIRNDW